MGKVKRPDEIYFTEAKRNPYLIKKLTKVEDVIAPDWYGNQRSESTSLEKPAKTRRKIVKKSKKRTKKKTRRR